MEYKMRSEVWLYPGQQGAWHFASVSKKLTATLRKKFANLHRGWSSLPVNVGVGKTEWRTSIFYDKRSEAYILPLKASVRKKEGIFTKDKLTIVLQIMV